MSGAVGKSHYQVSAEVIAKEMLGVDICKIVVRSPEISSKARAGQFVMVQVNGRTSSDPLLRRPFSIHQVIDDTFSILFKKVGRGTEILSTMQIADELDFVGPLGNGFVVNDGEVHYLVGGGMGVAPLLFLAAQIRKKNSGARIVALIGARNKNELVTLDELAEVEGLELQVATDDGSFGKHGLVTSMLADVTNKGNVYCCGPWPMMKAVAAICREKEFPCQVSLETMMACGVGACLGCAVEGAHDLLSGVNYLHVCKDGPVYEAVKVWG